MASSTFSGPVRSQNGFQEWNGTAWVPVAGGGGGGAVVEINTSNAYSQNFLNDPPIGPSAGTIITLPVVQVGETITIRPTGGATQFAWAIEIPPIPGVDLATFYGWYSANAFGAAFGGLRTGTVSYLYQISNITDTLYLYDQFVSDIVFTRLPDVVAPGFGVVAIFQQNATPNVIFTSSSQFASPLVYPWVNIAPP